MLLTIGCMKALLAVFVFSVAAVAQTPAVTAGGVPPDGGVGRGATVTDANPVTPDTSALIIALPTLKPFTKPRGLTLATVGPADTDQVMVAFTG